MFLRQVVVVQVHAIDGVEIEHKRSADVGEIFVAIREKFREIEKLGFLLQFAGWQLVSSQVQLSAVEE